MDWGAGGFVSVTPLDESTVELKELRRLLRMREADVERLTHELHATTAAWTTMQAVAAAWRTACDAIADPIAVMAGPCEVQRANQAFARFAGVPVTETQRLRCKDHAFGRLPCPGPNFAGESEQEVERNGATWLLRSFQAGNEGRVVLFKDVTWEKKAARRALLAGKLTAIGKLAGGVAHEMNNPLAGILALILVMSGEKRSSEDREKLELLRDAALRSKRLMDALLGLAQPLRAEDRVRVDLATVVEDALFMLGKRIGAGVELVQELRPAVCLGDAGLLSRLALNLLQNALEALAGAGTLTVRTGSDGQGTSTLSVSDSGPGIRLDDFQRIFEPFFTTRPGANGLGLTICNRIAQEHGGRIRLESSPGAGARFVLELPAAGI